MGKKALSIELSNEEREYLELQTRARTIQAQTVTRAQILLLRADAVSIDAIADKVGLNRCSVMLCLKKFKEGGVENALFDAGFFRKMTRQMLRGIRVKSKDELTNRIYKYFEEINENPIVFRWKYNFDDIDVSEEIVVDTLSVKKSS